MGQKELSPEYKQTKAVLEKYLDTGKISDTDLLLLKTRAAKEGMFGDGRLMEITEAMERQQAKKDQLEFNTMIGAPQVRKGHDYIKMISKVDAFSVVVIIALVMVGVGFIYPKLKELLVRSNRAVFVFMLAGLSCIMGILKYNSIIALLRW